MFLDNLIKKEVNFTFLMLSIKRTKNKAQKIVLQDLVDFAKFKNGKFLSENYINMHTKYLWECNVCTYKWLSSFANVKYHDSWCPNCAGTMKKTLQDAMELAKANGGNCLSNKYINNQTLMQWECGKCNYIWSAAYGSIQQDSWCPKCADRKRGLNKRDNIENMKNIAKRKHGRCLSSIYRGNIVKLKWECFEGHIWEATPRDIKCGRWCPYCLSKSEQIFRETLERMLDAKFPRRKPIWLVNQTGNRLELDGYNEELKIAFEYQGEQHYNANHYFNRKQGELNKRLTHDKIKFEECRKRDVMLLCPNYLLRPNDFEEFILENIKKQVVQYLIRR